ncbi:Crp/Fnr family transcriptional regulator [Streptococcus suis]|nr:Crp/Fnr family transcriptional regulator [Streptococcus suis]
MSQHLCVSLVPLFNQLPLEEQQKIGQLAHHQTFQKGEIIFSPTSPTQLSIVAQGQMKVYRLATNGKEQLLRVAEPGQYEGVSQLFGTENENLYGEALQKTVICMIYQSDFQQLLQEYPQLSLKLLSILAEKMTKVEQQTQFLTMEKIEERLALYLLDLSKSLNDSLSVTIPMTMKELAAYLGTTPETLSRKLKFFEQQGWIERNRRQITLLQLEELEDL